MENKVPVSSVNPMQEPVEVSLVVTDNGKPPRLWTALLCFPIVFVLYFIALFITRIVVALIVLYMRNSDQWPSMEAINAIINDPIVVLPASLPLQLVLVAMAVGAAILSPYPVRQRLNLKPIGLPLWAIACTAIGTLFVGSCGALLLNMMGANGNFYAFNPSVPLFLTTVVGVGILPGFGEEFIFRGYIQSRLLQRWPPVLAILFTSVIFAIMHINSLWSMLLALIFGIWIGVVAWRTGSVWTAVICHATVNTFSVIYGQFRYRQFNEMTSLGWHMALTLPFFLISAFVLFKKKPR